ncbi:SurA N-terminal domain-containing protein [Neopusillimonas maritima]|uniref:Periplasmic chaperone PpiD n=1 Tax=Neopusillimonas maritima TaxID=2026239 RepID=A0A3A1Z0D3_9BURK|nr:SurA N-terminal domain-containing protein [Neopusillimonas maritima]RIY41797.1 peptidylprolyl isomerase [Neopusillimonas maritima]
MFDFIRSHQRLMQLVLLILIFPSFALVGISGYTNYVSGDEDLVQVGDATITLQDFEAAQRNQTQQLQARMGAAFDPSVLETPQVRESLLESLIDRGVIIDTAQREHFSVSDTVLRRAISAIPELQVDGRFSPERYNEVLASMGISSRDFEQSQRSELALQRVLGPIAFTANVPATVEQYLSKALTAQRTVRLEVFDAANYEADIQVDEADIQAWYENNQEQLRVPEYVKADYLLLNEAAAMAAVASPTEQQLQDYYEQNKRRYVLPPRVQLSHILIQAGADASADEKQAARKKAEEIATRVAQQPDQFADIARESSEDIGSANQGGQLGWVTRGTLPPNLEQAVFSLDKGEVSGVVEGPDGFHVFLANDVQVERGETFEQAKAKVEAEVRRQLGAEQFADMASRLRDLAYDNPQSLEPAAQALGLEIKSASGIGADRLLPARQVKGNAASAGEDATLLEDPRVRRALFSNALMAEKQNSGVIEISPDTMLVVRVNEVVPSHIQPLEDVKEVIRQALVRERAAQAAIKAGETALQAYQNQAEKAEVPEGFGSAQTISRSNPQGVNPEVLLAAFDVASDSLPAYTGVSGDSGYVVVRVESAEQGEANENLNVALQRELDMLWAQAEERAVLRELRKTVGVEMLPEAQNVVQEGLDDEDA